MAKENPMVDFLGRGWNFPIRPEGTREEIAAAQEEEKIRQAIWIILATAPGERMMRPDFGCGIHDLVFAVNDATTTGQAIDAVRKSLVLWEPRIEVLDVGAEAENQGETLWIDVRYRVRTTNNFFNLVYPFYLGGSGS